MEASPKPTLNPGETERLSEAIAAALFRSAYKPTLHGIVADEFDAAMKRGGRESRAFRGIENRR